MVWTVNHFFFISYGVTRKVPFFSSLSLLLSIFLVSVSVFDTFCLFHSLCLSISPLPSLSLSLCLSTPSYLCISITDLCFHISLSSFSLFLSFSPSGASYTYPLQSSFSRWTFFLSRFYYNPESTFLIFVFPWFLSFQILHQINKGAYGQVLKVQRKEDGENYAMKVRPMLHAIFKLVSLIQRCEKTRNFNLHKMNRLRFHM